MLRKLIVAASSFSMLVAPVAAQAAEREASPVSANEHVAGRSTLGVVLGLAIAAGVFVLILHDNHTHDRPASP